MPLVLNCLGGIKSMKFSKHLTPAGRRFHSQTIDISKFKLNHIRTRQKSHHIHWETVLMLISLTNQRHKTIVVDSRQGLFAVPETTNQLFSTLKQKQRVLPPNSFRRIPIQAGITEYIPFIFGKLRFAPLKRNKSGDQIWIAAAKVENHENIRSADETLKVWFKDCEEPLIIPSSFYFLNSRLLEINQVRSYQMSLRAHISMVLAENANDFYTQYQLSKFPNSPLDLILDSNRIAIKEALNHYCISADEATIEAILRKSIQ